MQSIHGDFEFFRTRTIDGKNAILLRPISDVPLLYSSNDEADTATISFENDVEGGDSAPDSYLTLNYLNDRIHLGPYFVKPKQV